MNNFIDWLEAVNKNDTRARAVLRRSLAFLPGQFVNAYPYVEPFLKGEGNAWRREMHYLVAGLWASHWREGRHDQPLSIGKACEVYKTEKRSASSERRFIALLDSDSEQLPHRMRQMIALLKDQSIDFNDLLKRLLYWNDERKRSQNAWARDFYKNVPAESKEEIMSEEETA